MSAFSGKQYKGVMRDYRKEKRMEAYNRQLAIWNDGTGWIYKNPTNPKTNDYKRVCNPIHMLRKSEMESV